MSTMINEGNFQALVINDELSERPQRPSSTRQVRGYSAQESQPVSSQTPSMSEPMIEDWVTLSEVEGRYVARVLEHTGGNKQAAARVLAVDRKTLDRMIKRHHINAQRARVANPSALQKAHKAQK